MWDVKKESNTIQYDRFNVNCSAEYQHVFFYNRSLIFAEVAFYKYFNSLNNSAIV